MRRRGDAEAEIGRPARRGTGRKHSLRRPAVGETALLERQSLGCHLRLFTNNNGPGTGQYATFQYLPNLGRHTKLR